jgi:hypothetical protein
MSQLQKLRTAGLAHQTHSFSKKEVELIESLTDEEVATIKAVYEKLGQDLVKKKDPDDGPEPDTVIL